MQIYKVIRSSVFVALAFLFIKLSGFIREMVLAYAYGASTVTDAFVIASSLPSLFLTFLVSATATTYISVYASLEDSGRKYFTANLLTVFAIIASGLALLFFAFPTVFVHILASRADSDMISLASLFLRYMSWSTIPLLLASVLSARLQTADRFFAATAYQLFINAFLIIGILLATTTRLLQWMGIGMTLGNLVSLGFLIYHNKATGLCYRPT